MMPRSVVIPSSEPLSSYLASRCELDGRRCLEILGHHLLKNRAAEPSPPPTAWPPQMA
jgi:hypothetical protein